MLGVATSYPNPPRCTDTTKRPPGISNSTYKRVRAYTCKMRCTSSVIKVWKYPRSGLLRDALNEPCCLHMPKNSAA